jgi:hypothetical protein
LAKCNAGCQRYLFCPTGDTVCMSGSSAGYGACTSGCNKYYGGH